MRRESEQTCGSRQPDARDKRGQGPPTSSPVARRGARPRRSADRKERSSADPRRNALLAESRAGETTRGIRRCLRKLRREEGRIGLVRKNDHGRKRQVGGFSASPWFLSKGGAGTADRGEAKRRCRRSRSPARPAYRSAPASAGSTSPSAASTFRSASGSPRVAPRLMIATGICRCRARCTNRSPDITGRPPSSCRSVPSAP